MKSIRKQYFVLSIGLIFVLAIAAQILFKSRFTQQVSIIQSQQTLVAQNIADSISAELELTARELFLFEPLVKEEQNEILKLKLGKILQPRLEGRITLIIDSKDIVRHTFPHNREIEGLDTGAMPFVKEARESKSPTFSSLTNFAGEFANSMAVTVPIDNGDMLVEIVPAQVFSKITRTYQKNRAGFFAILDKHGTVISSSVHDRSLLRRNFSNIPCVSEAIFKHKAGACETRFFDEDGIASAATTHMGSLTVFMFLPNSQSLDFIVNLGVLFWGMFALLLIIFVATAWILWNRLFKPIHQITEKCARVASGDLSQTAQSKYSEFAPLMNGFTTMVSRINSRENDLLNALDTARNASHAKSQFLANFGHEVRTPLTTMTSVCELYRAGVITGDALDEYFSMIESSSNHLLDLVSQVILLTQAENRPLEIASVPVDLEKTILDVAGMILPRLQKSGVVLETSIHESVPKQVASDPLRLRQIFMNLLGNSAKFTEQGKITWQVSAQGNKNDAIRIVRFLIQDTGIGMSNEFLSKMFTPFTQEDESTSKKYSGAGLGLAISKNIVESMRGTIRCESEKGVGTTFVIELPMRTIL